MKRPKRKSTHRKRGKRNKASRGAIENYRLPLGLEAKVERVVAFEWTIAAYDSRLPAVFSTPAMIGLMELAAAQAIAPCLPPGSISVGTRIEVNHLKAVAQGTNVEARARLTGTSGRFLIFEAEARAGEHVIGRGRLFRAIVPLAPFTEKASGRS